jgi:hypoxanthine phosphoribosyltransferase
MERIKIKDKEFSKFIKYDDIQIAIKNLSKQINKDYNGKTPLFLVILNGAFMFAADLFKNLDFDCEISFVKLSSYSGTETTENVKHLIGINEEITGREVVIVEDIVDTGITIEHMINELNRFNPKEIKIATLLLKPEKYKKEHKIDYVALEIPNDFIVGYGLDYDGFGRNLPDIYKIA